MKEVLRLESCACFTIRKTARAVTRWYDAALAPSAIDANMFALLAFLAGVDEISLGELADGLVMDRSTVSRQLLPAIRRGFVAMRSGDDRRRRLIRLTKPGRAALSRAVPLWRRAQAAIVGHVGTRRVRATFDDLSALRRFAQSAPTGFRDERTPSR